VEEGVSGRVVEVVLRCGVMRISLALLALCAAVHAEEERILLAAGCFWSIELAYQRVPGVTKTAVGYAGGHIPNPTYHTVSSGTTGHAEAVEVVFDPTIVSLRRIVDLFWQLHDPTTRNRQGGDVGTQYRSAIWYSSDEQRKTIEASRAALSVADRVVTEIASAKGEGFVWKAAEDYHQRYLEKDGQDSTTSSLAPIQCYGKRGPIKKMDKPGIREILKGEL